MGDQKFCCEHGLCQELQLHPKSFITKPFYGCDFQNFAVQTLQILMGDSQRPGMIVVKKKLSPEQPYTNWMIKVSSLADCLTRFGVSVLLALACLDVSRRVQFWGEKNSSMELAVI